MAAHRVVPALNPSVAWRSRDHSMSQTKAGLPCFHRWMSGSQADKTPFDLRNLSLGRFKLDGCRRRLDIGARVCAGASLALSHRQPDGLRCWFGSMRGRIKEAALLLHNDPYSVIRIASSAIRNQTFIQTSLDGCNWAGSGPAGFRAWGSGSCRLPIKFAKLVRSECGHPQELRRLPESVAAVPVAPSPRTRLVSVLDACPRNHDHRRHRAAARRPHGSGD